MAQWDTLLVNVHLATMVPGADAYGAVRNGAIAVAGERIAWLGAEADLPSRPEKLAATVRDGGGGWVSPGLIDCHTHLVFGGNRAHEFEMRLEGASYEDIARAGGGIRSTVAATRAATEEALLAGAAGRLQRLMAEGVTTVEIKSGYGLETETEIKMLRVGRRLGADQPVTVKTTFLGAHALPQEYEGRRDAYVALVCDDMLTQVADSRLADAVDAFCETIAFTAEETAAVFEAANERSLPVKLHADQLSDTGGAALAARFGALSADHLEYTSAAGVEALADHGCTAVLLPGAFYFLGERQLPPVAALRRHGVPIAVASDANPGSSPAVSLLLMLNMACTLFGLSPAEALAGVTRNAARALGCAGDRGTLELRKRADLALWRVDHPAELAYWMGANPCAAIVQGGRWRDGPAAS